MEHGAWSMEHGAGREGRIGRIWGGGRVKGGKRLRRCGGPVEYAAHSTGERWWVVASGGGAGHRG
jgi:hypothetical protein